MMNEQISANKEAALLNALRDVHVTYVKQQITLLNALQDKFGTEVAQVVQQKNSALVCQAYFAGASDERSIEALINLLWEPLRTKGYEFSVTQSEAGVQMKCTACPWARLYRNLGGADWGHRLYCAVDEDLVGGFNPQIGFTRTKTLMEGDEYCDHFYYMKE